MRLPRASGILLHITSLPGRFGVGDLGPEAYRFVDFLASARQSIWQVLPLGPTGWGDSPYQSFSVFAGNPLLISLERLAEEGILARAELERVASLPEGTADYVRARQLKLPLLRRAFETFQADASAEQRRAFEQFCRNNTHWLDAYSVFMTLKELQGGAPWYEWPRELAAGAAADLARLADQYRPRVECQKYWQYEFWRQWNRLRAYCHARQIRIMGDVPIFAAHDSADAWSRRELFHLDAQGRMTVMSGVPPDYFSPTGQLWGNPLYRWPVLAETGYQWWIDRLRTMLERVDILRLDHFRGFESYWEVPGDATHAMHGEWKPGPGEALFRAVREALGEVAIVAETLGLITPEVEALRERLGFPGMAVLQFAFGGTFQSPNFMPHHYHYNLVVYTGTHDNDTTLGWWNSDGAGTTLTREQFERERAFARAYLATDGREMNWTLIRAAWASVADTAIAPLQDVLDLGSEARMNTPGRPHGNWRWRFHRELLTEAKCARLAEFTALYGRLPASR